MAKWNVKFNTTAAQPAWTASHKEKFGERNEGKIVEAETEKEAKQKFNEPLSAGERVNGFYLKATRLSNSFQNGRSKAIEAIQNKARVVGVRISNTEYHIIVKSEDGKRKEQIGPKFQSVEKAKAAIETLSRKKGTVFNIVSSDGVTVDTVEK